MFFVPLRIKASFRHRQDHQHAPRGGHTVRGCNRARTTNDCHQASRPPRDAANATIIVRTSTVHQRRHRIDSHDGAAWPRTANTGTTVMIAPLGRMPNPDARSPPTHAVPRPDDPGGGRSPSLRQRDGRHARQQESGTVAAVQVALLEPSIQWPNPGARHAASTVFVLDIIARHPGALCRSEGRRVVEHHDAQIVEVAVQWIVLGHVRVAQAHHEALECTLRRSPLEIQVELVLRVRTRVVGL